MNCLKYLVSTMLIFHIDVVNFNKRYSSNMMRFSHFLTMKTTSFNTVYSYT
uniref:Uncharacterized protein n=1 Tax=Octopus bimaculoides TaxID=37653 RepID=A0A0L8FXL4_OCTBM